MKRSSPRVLLVAATTGYQTRMFAQAAAELGLEVRLATDRCHTLEDPWGDDAIPVRFDQPEEGSERIARVAAGTPFHAVVGVGDRPALLAAHAARRLGLPFHPPEAVEAASSKARFRERLRDAGLPVPAFFQLRVDEDPARGAAHAPYPCVLKPLTLSASRGVIRANDPGEFIAAFQRIAKLLALPEIQRQRDAQNRFLQVEAYIEGREYALEGLFAGGRLQVVALFDKPDPLEGPYFEETIYVTPSRAPAAVQAAIAETVSRAAAALGLGWGPVHAEMRVNDRGVWLLELAARPIGGLCARALRFGETESLEHVVLRHALGEDTSSRRLWDAASGVMMIPVPGAGILERVTGVEEARRVPGIWDVRITAKTGYPLTPLPEGASYPGFLFARGESAAEVEAALREAHARLGFQIAATLPVIRAAGR